MLAMYGFHLDFFLKLLQTIYYKVRVCKLCIFTFLKNVSLFLRSFFQKSLSLCSNLYTKQICKYLYQIVQTIYIKTAISNHFLPYKKCVTEKKKYVNKECNLLNPYFLTVLLSIQFNKLPWLKLKQMYQRRKIKPQKSYHQRLNEWCSQ